MKTICLAIVAGILAIGAAYAQGGGPPPDGPPMGGPPHGFGRGGPGPMHAGKVVSGAPYSATATDQFSQTLSGALRLFRVESGLHRQEAGNGFPVAGYYYFGTVLDLVEEGAQLVSCFKRSNFTQDAIPLADLLAQ